MTETDTLATETPTPLTEDELRLARPAAQNAVVPAPTLR
jgi:hypothetical protein